MLSRFTPTPPTEESEPMLNRNTTLSPSAAGIRATRSVQAVVAPAKQDTAAPPLLMTSGLVVAPIVEAYPLESHAAVPMLANAPPLTLASTIQPSQQDSVEKLEKNWRRRLPPAVTAGMVSVWRDAVVTSLVNTPLGAELLVVVVVHWAPTPVGTALTQLAGSEPVVVVSKASHVLESPLKQG